MCATVNHGDNQGTKTDRQRHQQERFSAEQNSQRKPSVDSLSRGHDRRYSAAREGKTTTTRAMINRKSGERRDDAVSFIAKSQTL